ncbi:iron-sulfur cluster-binding protein [Solemya velum gill symbiont]|uniref:LutB/LldF family L-lactate oxidation iron-sulfur protein n=1 Tax=Solemya velum gill symbiont TaxID=2340 RepID=UPI000997ACA9|nr:LutB/LldF family L-lactate oxidation iron-sulfur protein [Solemya velum gill symbiont]OOZ79811.1 iron-sulfur cluster-binding protein [Solemya velum gill symbiont]
MDHKLGEEVNSRFGKRIGEALADPQIRRNFRNALDGVMAKRAEQFPDPDELWQLRNLDKAIRANSLHKLPQLLEQLEQQLTDNGIQVHWAVDGEEANKIVSDILDGRGVKKIIKGKSMVTEETGLNHHLEQLGYEVIESDLGEYIIQLAEEPPSHIVAPAIHKSRLEIADLFAEKFPDIPYTDDVDEMTHSARLILRKEFASADAGISGVNFAVAETGTLCLVENEGNGRLSTTAPPIHIAVTGIEKVVKKLSDVPPLLSILTRSATGQPITTYFNMISSPRKEHELDGPEEVHLVLLDNGRSAIREDDELDATLRCIRCGACINHCPVYVRVGGHAYGTVYPGPIGSVLEPQRLGIQEAGKLATACSLCGRCGEVCPVKIPLPQLINRIRAESNEAASDSTVRGHNSLRSQKEALTWKLWSALYRSPLLYGLFTRTATTLRALTPSKLGAWTRYRKAPKPAVKSLHAMVARKGVDHE